LAERVAVLGTGIMGAPMARNLLKAGFQVPVWNRTAGKAHVLATEGVDQAETPADAVREAAFVITMLTDTAAVLAVMGQAAASMPDGAVWLQTSMDTEVERDRACGSPRDHVRELSRARHQGNGQAGPARRARVRTRRRPRPGTADLRRDRSKTVRLGPGVGRATRTKLVAGAWTVALMESLRAQLSRAVRGAQKRSPPGLTPLRLAATRA
jgi:3-hydroxyisobutyrate dehydrogenase